MLFRKKSLMKNAKILARSTFIFCGISVTVSVMKISIENFEK